MKELGNLAVVCAGRMDILLQIYDGYACVYVGEGPERAYMIAPCNDDEALRQIVRELNFGKYAKKERMEQNDIYTKAA